MNRIVRRMGSACAGILLSLAVHAAEGGAASIPFKQDAAGIGGAASGGALGILFISAAAIGLVYVIRKRLNVKPPGQDSALLRVLETQKLGPRALLSVVEFAGGHYLIAQGEHGIHCLAKAPERQPGSGLEVE